MKKTNKNYDLNLPILYLIDATSIRYGCKSVEETIDKIKELTGLKSLEKIKKEIML